MGRSRVSRRQDARRARDSRPMLTDALDEAFTRIEDFLAVQTAGGSRIELDNVLRLRSPWASTTTRGPTSPSAWRRSAERADRCRPAGLLVGLSAAQL